VSPSRSILVMNHVDSSTAQMNILAIVRLRAVESGKIRSKDEASTEAGPARKFNYMRGGRRRAGQGQGLTGAVGWKNGTLLAPPPVDAPAAMPPPMAPAAPAPTTNGV
jgi:hypothetical protein